MTINYFTRVAVPAIVANAHLISPSQISGLDLFDVPPGETEVTGYSGTSSSSAECDPAGGSPYSVTENPNDMFSCSGGSSCRAIVFADDQQSGTKLD